jgi:hypothetical protein
MTSIEPIGSRLSRPRGRIWVALAATCALALGTQALHPGSALAVQTQGCEEWWEACVQDGGDGGGGSDAADGAQSGPVDGGAGDATAGAGETNPPNDAGVADQTAAPDQTAPPDQTTPIADPEIRNADWNWITVLLGPHPSTYEPPWWVPDNEWQLNKLKSMYSKCEWAQDELDDIRAGTHHWFRSQAARMKNIRDVWSKNRCKDLYNGYGS